MTNTGKRTTLDKIFHRGLPVFTVTALVVASLIILGKQNIPAQLSHAFVRSLTRHGDESADAKRDVMSSESDFEPYDDEGYRLSGDVIPKAYDLWIATNLTTLTFSGHVEITVSCALSTQQIILHAKRLEIASTKVSVAKTNKPVKITGISTHEKYDHYIIDLDKPLRKHREYVIRMSYRGNVSKTLDGFYRSYYTTGLGEKRPLVVTHFEPTYARTAFPCFDEPAFRATFTLHISRDPTHQSLSNMARDHQEDKSLDLVIDHYKPTPVMSTYLLGFMVLDFDYQETETPSGVRVCVYAPPEDKLYLSYALEVASKTLSFYEKLLGVPFPLRKLDLVAVPDFLGGGMEEWGLINMRREFLVYDEKFVSAKGKKKMTSLITHEIAHMWFGNLVGIKWWNEAWLKEGFAKFFAYLAKYNLDKETDSLAVSLLDSWMPAFNSDRSSHAHSLIGNNVETPNQIEDFFDGITYQKGAMLLKMVMNTLGNGPFLKGIRLFIEKAKYGTVDSSDLWISLSQVGKRLNMTRLMATWTEQASYPIVTLKRLSGPEKDIILAKQESFLEHEFNQRSLQKDGNSSKANNETQHKRSFSSSLWHIPLTYTVQSTAFKEYTVWLDKKWEKLSVLDPAGWIKANVRASGYYIVNYDKRNWIKLIKQLKNYHVVFSPSDRAGLIHDVFALACEGMLDASIALKLVLYMPKEEHYVPVAMLRKKSKCLGSLFKDKETKQLYEEYLWYLQEHLVHQLGMKDKGGLLEQLHRYDTLVYAMKHGREDVKKHFVRLFKKLRKNKDFRIPPRGITANFRELAFTQGANKTSKEDWQYMWDVYESSPYDSDRKFLRPVLSSFEDQDLFNKNLENSIDPSKVRSQDTLRWLSGLSTNTTKTQVSEFVKKNINTLNERYGTKKQLAILLKHAKKMSTNAIPSQRKPTLGIKKATKWLRRYMKKVKRLKRAKILKS